MNKLLSTGRMIFAIGIIALAVLCIIAKDFIVGRPPVWPVDIDNSANPLLAYTTAAILIIASLAIMMNRKAFVAALTIAGSILLLSVSRHLPKYMDDWPNTYKAIALFGGALIIAASFLKNNNRQKNALIITGCICLAAFFIASGYAHFKYDEFVKTLIPSFIPFHSFWTYFAAICLFAGAAGILLPQTRSLAALLSGIMILGWFLLLHIPRFIADTNNVSDRLGVFESFTFAGIFFVLSAITRSGAVDKIE